jgi:hypothetical protein
MENIEATWVRTSIFSLIAKWPLIISDKFHTSLDCHQSLTKLAEHNTIQLVYVSRHIGNDGNEIIVLLARQGSLHPFVGPECAFGISTNVTSGVIRDWISG